LAFAATVFVVGYLFNIADQVLESA